MSAHSNVARVLALVFACTAAVCGADETPKPAPEPIRSVIAVAPAAIDFDKQRVGTSTTQSFLLTTTSDKVTVKRIWAGGDFSVVPDHCELTKTGACAITVTFSPRRMKPSGSAASIEFEGQGTPQVVTLKGEGDSPDAWEYAVVIGLLAVYFLGFATVRWNLLAVPMRRNLKRRIESLRRRMEILDAAQASAGIGMLKELLKKATEVVEKHGRCTPANFLFWSRGVEMAGWSYVHDVEQQFVAYLPTETVRAGLERAEAELRQMNAPTATAHADYIKETLAAFSLPSNVRLLLADMATATGESMSFGQRLELALATPTGDVSALASDAARSLEKFDALVGRVDALIAAAREDVSAALQDDTKALAALHADTQSARDALAKQIAAAPAGTAEAYRTALTGARTLFARLDGVDRLVRRRIAGVNGASLERQKALLSEALGILYREKDRHFTTLMTWHNKTTWLMGCALLLMAAISLTLPNAIFFLVGAAGGLLSRLSRALIREDVPHEYGVSWVPLFLSPVMGALSAWAGILVLDLLRQWKILGQAVDIDWANPYHTATLAIAFALGFAERLFDTFMTQLQETITKRASPAPVAPPTMGATASGGTAAAGSANAGGQATS